MVHLFLFARGKPKVCERADSLAGRCKIDCTAQCRNNRVSELCRKVKMIIKSEDAEKEAALEVARLMLVAARTAPKARGLDTIVTAIIGGEDKNRLTYEMERVGKEKNLPMRVRDAGNVRNCEFVVLVGVKYEEGSSKELKLVDLGIALGSAAKVAGSLNVDNRIMRSVGEAAENLKLLQANYVIGIPISTAGKNPFFDRPPVVAT